MKQEWHKNMVFYQIWVRSFCDGNDDGIGDLYGVYSKLEYIKSLGVDGIWFSPLYPSPNADYGYDISDYYNIHPDYGTLEQFKKVLRKAHELGMRVLMDLVVNHTSDEHPWFKQSRKSRNNPYSDYYIWRDAKRNKLPNNWNSLFEGKAWEYEPQRDQYYLHLFAKKQPDLNMDNPKVREEVKRIMRYWLDIGVDGFREDVITFISKREGLPNGLPFIPAANGMLHYKDGPHIHEYLKEFREVCEPYNCLLLGEGPLTTTSSALSYMTGDNKTLDLMFQFDHMMADCLLTEYVQRPFKLTRLKRAFSKWQNKLNGKAWNTLYLENHDHPRVISRYGNEAYWRESGTMLAACYLFQQGTPFVYQGQEIGMTNIRLRNIKHYIDVSTQNNFNSFHVKDSLKQRMARIYASSRDSSRTPMQWSSEKYAGFSTVKPWFYINHNYKTVNVQTEEKQKDSILQFYRACIQYRKQNDILLKGTYKEYFKYSEKLYMYERKLNDKRILVICSFSDHMIHFEIPKALRNKHFTLRLCNYSTNVKAYTKFKIPALRKNTHKGFHNNMVTINNRTLLHIYSKQRGWLRPYEARVYEVN